jgi:two-component system CheB/CheR fusion protein
MHHDSIKITRELARGLLPVVSEGHSFASALEQYAGEVSERFNVTCRFDCNDRFFLHEGALAEHLHRLAQEAVTNAMKHGKSKHITIGLSVVDGRGELTIRDDGRGFDGVAGNQSGLGLRIMTYRAKMIGGSVNVQSSVSGGTLVKCVFPIPDQSFEAQHGT